MAGDIERRPLPALLLPEIGREYKDFVRAQPPLYWGGAVNHGLTRSSGHTGLPITQCVNHVSGIQCDRMKTTENQPDSHVLAGSA